MFLFCCLQLLLEEEGFARGANQQIRFGFHHKEFFLWTDRTVMSVSVEAVRFLLLLDRG